MNNIPQEPMIVIGICETEQGILFTRDENGTIQLPGGKAWRTTSHARAKQQKAYEAEQIARIVFEKSGLYLAVASDLGYYTIKDPKTIYKVFLLKPADGFVPKTWKRDVRFEGAFITADLKQILESYPDLSASDKHILADYFKKCPQIPQNTEGNRLKLLLVQNIA